MFTFKTPHDPEGNMNLTAETTTSSVPGRKWKKPYKTTTLLKLDSTMRTCMEQVYHQLGPSLKRYARQIL